MFRDLQHNSSIQPFCDILCGHTKNHDLQFLYLLRRGISYPIALLKACFRFGTLQNTFLHFLLAKRNIEISEQNISHPIPYINNKQQPNA